MAEIHKTGIVAFNDGAFGGAAKRYTNLFVYLDKLYPGYFFYLVNNHIHNQIKEIYPDIDFSNIYVIDDYTKEFEVKNEHDDTPSFFKDTVPDPLELDRMTSLTRKIYWYYKNRLRQKNLFRKIERVRSRRSIKVFYGISSGILPLVFYAEFNRSPASIVFADVDSWFTDVHSDMKKLWYRKYYSYNYAIEKCDYIDFLSPYIVEGVKKLGVKIKDENISVSPCSFTDYSKCMIGEKSAKEAAFCSRLEPDKNPMLFLEAARETLKKHPDAKFYILGEGSLVNEIRQYIDSAGLGDKIVFRFHKNPPELFRNTSIFVSLQKNTNYPSQSLLEAMACGNAVVASNTGDTNLLVNDNNGKLVELGAREISNAINDMLCSKEKTYERGINARNYVLENHTIEKYAEYFLNLIDSAYRKRF